MNEFCLIQTGSFYSDKNYSAYPFNDKYFFKNIELNATFAREYNTKNMMRSKTRMLHCLESYTSVKTGISLSDTEELVIFCDEEKSKTIINMIKEYISNPYEIHGKVKPKLFSDVFWWCLDFRSDVPSFGDWMACSSKNISVLRKNFLHFYVEWSQISENKRQQMYEDAISW